MAGQGASITTGQQRPDAERGERGRAVLLTTAVVCAIAGMSALAVAALAGLEGSWFIFGLEIVVIVASALGVIAGRGGFSSSVPMALACVGGVIAVASFLGVIGSDRSFLGPFGRELAKLPVPGAPLGVDGLLIARLLIGGGLLAMAGTVLLRRDPARNVPLLVRGCALGIAFAVIASGMWLGRGMIGNLPGVVQAAIVFFGSILLIGLVSASGHCLINAFASPKRAGPDAETSEPGP